MGNWVKRLNLLQKESNEVILDKAVDIYDKYINHFTIANENLEEIKFTIELKEFKNFNEEVKFVYSVIECVKGIDKNINPHAISCFSNEIDKIIDNLEEKIKDISHYSMFTGKEANIFVIRATKYVSNTKRNLLNFCLESTDKFVILHKYIDDYIENTADRLRKSLNQEKEEIMLEKIELQRRLDDLKSQIMVDYQKDRKIFDYKKMLKLAINNGYEHKRTTGDHLILQHKESQKIIVIPAHNLGKGLMLEIQKQIRTNKIA